MTSQVIYSNNYVAANHLDQGIAYLRKNRFAEAIAEFDENLSLTPSDPYAHWNKAIALLSIGDYTNGFSEHDWGWRLFDWRQAGPVGDDIDRLKELPIWHGEDISDQRLLVYHELGFGDAIMTLRYLPELKCRAEHVTLIVDHSLTSLAEQFGIEVIEKVPDDINGYDYRLPLFGVLSALHQMLDNIPRSPYIFAIFNKSKHVSGRPRMGIAWSGRTQTMFSLETFLSKLDHEDYPLLQSLQFGADAGIEKVLPLKTTDFSDTVELIAQMDHVVTVDTAAAHLAGAMGHPSVHLLLPFMMDWRWWNCCVWYPTIKTYRQETPDDWSIPFARLNVALKV